MNQNKIIRISFSYEEIQKIKKLAKRKGFDTPSAYITYLISKDQKFS